MKNTEAIDRFDVLYNNIMSNAAPGLNEYEKSVYCTKAQDEILKDYFNPKGNKYGQGFDGGIKRQIDFGMLMKVDTPSEITETVNACIDARSTTYKLKDDIFFIVNESMELQEGEAVKGVRQVIPVSYMEYTRLMSKPFKEPLKNQAWRLFSSQDDYSIVAEVLLNNADRKTAYNKVYKVRYVRKPEPIILVDLASAYNGLSINGKTSPWDSAGSKMSELDESIHEEILQRAVELAKAAYSSDQSGQAQFQNQVTIGQRSE